MFSDVNYLTMMSSSQVKDYKLLIPPMDTTELLHSHTRFFFIIIVNLPSFTSRMIKTMELKKDPCHGFEGCIELK